MAVEAGGEGVCTFLRLGLRQASRERKGEGNDPRREKSADHRSFIGFVCSMVVLALLWRVLGGEGVLGSASSNNIGWVWEANLMFREYGHRFLH
ncbi:unnamed protein product [Dovyalis caffra]|uniref:Uncharacterized protein n=1 Tax=Dovyalis caffra TaxID=77055 RepID=A0AAV1R1K7_9ROSI|nr:unnamed protein product [Dovyalis caffra]